MRSPLLLWVTEHGELAVSTPLSSHRARLVYIGPTACSSRWLCLTQPPPRVRSESSRWLSSLVQDIPSSHLGIRRSYQATHRHAPTRGPFALQLATVVGDFYFLPSTLSSTSVFGSLVGASTTGKFELVSHIFAYGIMVYLIVRSRHLYDLLREC